MLDEKIAGQLFIVPTPIGNLGDMTQRAIETLKTVDLIAAEDTRHTGKLLQQFAIKTPMFALHDHNEQDKAHVLIEKLQSGVSIAIVSDAGTPLINDPGYHVVKLCHQHQLRVIPLPGACAAITALSASGLPSNRFTYEGFLPAKSKARMAMLKLLIEEPRTMIFYESPHRIKETLSDMLEVFGQNRHVVIARELTKIWETVYGAPLGDLFEWLIADENRQRGEFVVMVEGFNSEALAESDGINAEVCHTLQLLMKELPLKKAAAITAEIYGLKKNMLYQWGLEHPLS